MAHAKGDIEVSKDVDGVGILPVSTDGHVLTLDSTQTLGIKWAAGGGGVGATGATGPTGPTGSSVLKGLRIRRVANQSVNNTTTTAISFDTEDEDSSGYFAPTSSTITVPSGEDGIYAISVRFGLSGNVTGKSFLSVTAGGVEFRVSVPSTDDGVGFGFTKRLVATNTVVASAYQTSGGALNLTAHLEMWKVGT